MSHSLNSLMGGNIRDYIGTTIGDIKGDTRSLDYSSYACTFLDARICQCPFALAVDFLPQLPSLNPKP